MPGFEETAAAQECAGNYAGNAGLGPLLSERKTMAEAEYLQQMRAQRFAAAMHTLKAADALRADKTFMAELREYVRNQRDELGALLDDLG